MISMGKYITNEYKSLLYNATLVLSIILLAVIGINVILAIIAPIGSIKLFVILGLITSVASVGLLYTAIKHFTDYRDPIVIIKWITSFLCLFVGLLPTMLFVYLNLDWKFLSAYGKMAIDIYWSFENMVLPIAFGVLVSLIYWTLTIQLYKKSYTTYLCLNKKKEIYE